MKKSLHLLSLLVLVVSVALFGNSALAQQQLPCRTFGTNATTTTGSDVAVDPTTGDVYFITSSSTVEDGVTFESNLYKFDPAGNLLYSLESDEFFFNQVTVDAAGNPYLGVTSVMHDNNTFSESCPTPIENGAVIGLDPETGACRFALPRDLIFQLEGDTAGPNVYVNYGNFSFFPGSITAEKVNAQGEVLIPSLVTVFQNPPAGVSLNIDVAQNGSLSVLSAVVPPRGIPGVNQRLIQFGPAGNVISNQTIAAGRIFDYVLDSESGQYYAILTADPRFICGREFFETNPEFRAVLASLDCSALQGILDPNLQSIEVDEENGALYLFGNNKFARYDIVTPPEQQLPGFRFRYERTIDIANAFFISDLKVDPVTNQVLIAGTSSGTEPIMLGDQVFPRQARDVAVLVSVNPVTGALCGATCVADNVPSTFCETRIMPNPEFYFCTSTCAFTRCIDGQEVTQACPAGTVCQPRFVFEPNQGSSCIFDPNVVAPGVGNSTCSGLLQTCP